jgi:hypothetical protein
MTALLVPENPDELFFRPRAEKTDESSGLMAGQSAGRRRAESFRIGRSIP